MKLVQPAVAFSYVPASEEVALELRNPGGAAAVVNITSNSPALAISSGNHTVPAGGSTQLLLSVKATGCWHDFEVSCGALFSQRFAGRMETGADGISDPSMAWGL